MIQNFDRRLKQARVSVEKADISQRNKDIIFEFCDYMALQEISKGRILRYYSALKLIAKWLDKDFDKVDEEDMTRLITKLHDKDYTDWTRYTFKVIIKRFYKWVIYKDKKTEYPPLVSWIKATMNSSKCKLPNEGELLIEKDITKLLDVCKSTRNKAFISILWESGARISEIGNLKMKNVIFDEYGTLLNLYGKTGSRKIRVINSTSHLATWLNCHPEKDNPDAFIWIDEKLSKYKNRPLTYQYINKIIKDIFARAGIKKKSNPHAFRHSRATFMANHLTEFQMNQYFGWVQGSNMPSTYVHLSGRDTDESILRMNGIKIESKKEEISKPNICPRCQMINASDNKFCSQCGCMLDEKEQFEMQKKEDARDKADELIGKLLENKDIVKLLAEKMRAMG